MSAKMIALSGPTAPPMLSKQTWRYNNCQSHWTPDSGQANGQAGETDPSGGVLQDLMAVGTWSCQERKLHINILEMTSLQLDLSAFLDRISGQLIVLIIVRFTQLCSKFPPTALLNFACDG